MTRGSFEELGPRGGALGKGRGIERRCGQGEGFAAGRYRALRDGQGKQLNDRSVSMLRNRQNDTIGLLRSGAILVIVMIMLRASGMLVPVSGTMFSGRGELLEEMMDAMRGRNDQEEQKRHRSSQIEPAPGRGDLSLCVDHCHISYSAVAGIATSPVI